MRTRGGTQVVVVGAATAHWRLVCFVVYLMCGISFVDALWGTARATVSACGGVPGAVDSEKLIRSVVACKSPDLAHPTIWYHEGYLLNPSNGQPVAGIVGIESVQRLSDSSYLSNKRFCYVHPQNRSEILSSFRQQPVAPLRRLGPAQNSKSYAEIVRFSPSPNGKRNIRCEIEFPGGRHIYSKECSVELAPTSSLSIGRYGSEMVVSTSISPVNATRLTNRWLSFGAPARTPRSIEQYHFVPVHESWVRSFARKALSGREMPPQHSMRAHYRRFGEGPSWLLPGRPFLVELQSLRMSKVSDLPVVAKEILFGSESSEIEHWAKAEPQTIMSQSRDQLLDYPTWWEAVSRWSSRWAPQKHST